MSVRRSHLFLVLFISIFSVVNAQNGMSAVQYFRAGVEKESTGDLFAAYGLYQKSIQVNPYYVNPVKGLAGILFKMQQYDQALEFSDKALTLDPLSTEIKNLKGRILTGLGRFEDAEKVFSEILVKHPYNLEARLGLADLDAVFGSFSNAISSYSKILDAYPENSRALMAIILVYDNIKKFSEADKYINKAIVYYPNNGYIRMLAARHFRINKDYISAENQAKFALKVSTESIEPAILLSQIYLDQQKYHAAYDLLQVYSESDNLQVLYLLGFISLQLDRIDKAVSFFKKVLLLSPGDELTRIVLEETVRAYTDFDSVLRKDLGEYHFNLAKELFRRSFYNASYLRNRRGLYLLPQSSEGVKGLADYYKVNGYLGRYYSKIEKLRALFPENLNYQDLAEYYESAKKSYVSYKWQVDQFAVKRDPVKISIFSYSQLDTSVHYGSSLMLLKYFTHIVNAYEGAETYGESLVVDSYADAFQRAQKEGSEYFLVFDAQDSSRVFSAEISVYFTSSGIKVASFSSSASGNNRIIDTLNIIVKDFFESLSPRGHICQINFEKGLINLGKIDGVKKGDILNIIKKDRLVFKGKGFGFDASGDSIVGTYEVVAVDDYVSEGIVKKKYYYDAVNELDFVVYPPAVEKDISDGGNENKQNKDAESIIQQSEKSNTADRLLEEILKIF
jgi:tetratricopeptide (TPR) repeat protein